MRNPFQRILAKTANYATAYPTGNCLPFSNTASFFLIKKTSTLYLKKSNLLVPYHPPFIFAETVAYPTY